MSTVEAGAVLALSVILGLNFLVFGCLRGTEPKDRPAILKALAEVLRSSWPRHSRGSRNHE